MRPLKGTMRFYCFEPPPNEFAWNVAERMFNLRHDLDRLEEAMAVIRVAAGELKDPQAARRAIEEALWVFEEIAFWEPAIVREEWARDSWDALAHAYVRHRDDRLADTRLLGHEIARIVRAADSGNKVLAGHLTGYFAEKADFLMTGRLHDDLTADVEEAQDLVTLNYYSTALFVVGRAAERAIDRIGSLRGIRKVKRGTATTAWHKASFALKKDAIAADEYRGKSILTRRDALELQILIDHRNSLAHKDHEKLDPEEGRRALADAHALLVKLSKAWSDLEGTRRRPRTVEIRE